MTDRELLELAAKAAGVDLVWDGDKPKEVVIHWSGNPECGGETREWDWNPLLDDGDALRLAVKLEINISHRTADSDAFKGDMCRSEYTPGHTSRDAATRRAIVRLAAEIGRVF